MSRTPRKPPLALDMDFSEAVQRFAKVKPEDLKKLKENKTSQAVKPR